MINELWRIGTAKNPTDPDQTPVAVSPDQDKTIDAIALYMEGTGEVDRPGPLEPGEEYWDRQPITVYVGSDGTYAGAPGVLMVWNDPVGVMFRAWVLDDGTVGSVQQDVIDRKPDLDDEEDDGESHWERRVRRMAELRTVAGAVPRPFM